LSFTEDTIQAFDGYEREEGERDEKRYRSVVIRHDINMLVRCQRGLCSLNNATGKIVV
jgi:hypothetical protein